MDKGKVLRLGGMLKGQHHFCDDILELGWMPDLLSAGVLSLSLSLALWDGWGEVLISACEPQEWHKLRIFSVRYIDKGPDLWSVVNQH